MVGLALAGLLYWALTQITARHRRLQAELYRLEQLAAEVSLNAEAVLTHIDDRIERLTALLAKAETRAAEGQAAPVAPSPGEQSRQVNETPPEPAPTAPPKPGTPASIQRYQQVRSAVWNLADQGQELGAIAAAVGLPRGEIQLLLNLRSKKNQR